MRVRFGEFLLDTEDRLLRQAERPVDVNGRYFDALVLLVRQNGKLVSKDRFFEEVWRGVPVTDEALTQCVRTLRRQLGDNAAAPRFIETVPKHGYRFIAPVEEEDAGVHAPLEASVAASAGARLAPVLAGTAGGAAGGAFGGIFYGLVATAGSGGEGASAGSLLLVLLFINMIIGALGGAGVSLGITLANMAAAHRMLRTVAGGGLGGLAVGALVKLIGLDAFGLLLGQTPGDVTGGGEGALLGAAVGLGAWAAYRGDRPRLRLGVAAGALAGGAAGILISLAGGRLMGGSLHLLSLHFSQSRLRLDGIGGLLGEDGFGPASHVATAALEGAVFCGCVLGAMITFRRVRGRAAGRKTV